MTNTTSTRPFQHGWGQDLTADELDTIAATDEGLLYLDNLRGSIERRRRRNGGLSHADCITYTMLNDLLDDDAIARDLDRLIRDRCRD